MSAGIFHSPTVTPEAPPTFEQLEAFAEEVRRDQALRRMVMNLIMRHISWDMARVFAGRVRVTFREVRARERRAGYRWLRRRARRENGGFGA
jgi:hypothetical protein